MNDRPRIHGGGTTEADWQAWDGLARIETVAAGSLLPGTARCVVVAPHPDDEVLACGGLLAMHLAQGGRGLVIGVTDGEASHRGVPGHEPARLGARRHAERLAGLQALGVAPLPVRRLGLPDGRVAAHRESLAASLGQLLAPDDVVVTTWRHDGHPDHEACGEAAASACERHGARLLEAPVWMWHWAAPADPQVPWPRLRGVPVPAPLVERRRAALQAHASQWEPRGVGQAAVLTPGIGQRLARPFEYFFV